MNYDDIIKRASQERQKKQALHDLEAQSREEQKNQDIARAKRKFTESVIVELEKARLSLIDNGHHAEISNGDTQHGPRRCLRLDPQHQGAYYGIVFQLITAGPILQPELRSYLLQDGLTPSNPLENSRAIGSGPDFSIEQIQEIIEDFIKKALIQ